MKVRVGGRNWAFIIATVIVGAYFSYFVMPSLNGWFNDDDPLNIYYFWSRGPWALTKGLILFFTPYYRPMAGVYFYSLYTIFGLNSFPYHLVIVILLLINVALAYRCAALLSGSRIVGGLCAVMMAYHARLSPLAYLPAFVYDVICFSFFFGALLYYLRVRTAGRELTVRQKILFLLLYIGAMESKEMAVSLPVMILAYEFLWHTPASTTRSVLDWLRKAALPSLLAGLLTLCYIAGKSVGPEALSKNPAYHATITFGRFFESNVHFAQDIFYLKRDGQFGPGSLILLWALLAYVGWRRRENHFRWAVIMTIVAPLPIAFIPGRGGAMLYIPSFGWALILATLVAAICNAGAREPLLRFLRVDIARGLLLLGVVGLLWHETDRQNHRIAPGYARAGTLFRSVKEQLAILLPSVRPGTQIAFYNDIFETWDTRFVTELFYHDRSITTLLHPKTPLSPTDFEKADYVLAYEQERLVVLKRPNQSFMPPQKFVDCPGFRIEANAKEITAGKDTLVLRLLNFTAKAMDVLYRLNGRPMPVITGWRLNESHRISVFVDSSTPRGTYHFQGIRDSSSQSLNEWIPVDLQITVK